MTQQGHLVRRRTAALIAIPAIGALALAGCSGGGATEGGGGTGDSVEFSLTYATSNNLESPFEALAKAYEDANPDVTITLNPVPNDTYGDTLRTQLQAGNASDVIQSEAGSGQTRSIIPLAEAGFLEPLGDSATELIPEGGESLFVVDGKTYGQPLVLQYTGLIYNQTTADGAGVDGFPEEWDEFIDLCTDMRDQGKTALLVAGAAAPNAGMLAMNIAATRVYAENPDWNADRIAGDTTFTESDGWKDTFQAIIDLNDAGCIQDGAVGGGFDVLTNGITSGAGLGFFGPLASATELLQAAPDQDFVAHAFPPAESGDQAFGVASPTYSLSITEASDKKEAAQEFLEWVSEPEQAGLFAEVSGGLPITGIADVDLSDTVYAPVEDLLKNGEFTALPNQSWPTAAVYEALAKGVQGVLTGQSTVDSVLESLDAAWEQ
ncbi:ABC transporter substrate-binding protein [Microbacterium sp. NPDC058345]|uniref:ABC transporter substrate-binding protein n=1 Tax=Microbacterium sp. NPDC058345 TaxID=3346455 RepID=UPI00364E5D91